MEYEFLVTLRPKLQQNPLTATDDIMNALYPLLKDYEVEVILSEVMARQLPLKNRA